MNQVTSISNIGSGVVLSGTSQWSDFGNSDPIADVRTGAAFIRQTTGLQPNTILLSHDVSETLIDHPDVLARQSNSTLRGREALKTSLSQIFGVDQILFGDAVRNVAVRGATNSLVDVWSGVCIIAYVDPSPSLETRTGGVTFATFSR